MVATKTGRKVVRVVEADRVTEGDGVSIRRAFPTRKIEDFDPFLLIDHMGPIDYAPGQATGFPEHPHRGFETVTYLLDGAMEHKDSHGNHGILAPGDVQWMTAGSGLVHSEMPGEKLRRDGGRLQGFQVWVNLPRVAKMSAPKYQELPSAQIPLAETADKSVQVKIIAGESLGEQARISTHTPILYLHFTLQPGASVTQAVPASFNALAYVIEGVAAVGDDLTEVKEGALAILAKSGGDVVISNPGTKPVSLLLLGGEPIGEPVARYGPFVMNTKAELQDAFEDFRNGKMGTIEA